MSANIIIAVGYLRLSREEAKHGESSSIKTQRTMIADYCNYHGINIVKFYADDGWSGGNFDRPGFQEMMRELENGIVNTVITKDLSRLGRDMRESSYYAEQFFPEHGIRYLTIADNFDNSKDNVMAPFQFAMNEVYLRDCSKKVRDALRTKRENGQYCTCAPYGYMKDPTDRNHLIPDDEVSDVVTRIFSLGAEGYSCDRIADALNADGVLPPLKFKVLYRADFSEKGASRATDYWSGTTVADLQRESVSLKQQIAELEKENEDDRREENYRKFFSLVKQHTVIDELDEDTLRTFVERIEVGPKELPEGVQIATNRNQPYRQKIRIIYRFIGELTEEPERQFPIEANQ